MTTPEPLPALVAILRGLTPPDAESISDALVDAGFRAIEVPLNSPDPLDSINIIARRHPALLIGAGTVLTVEEVRKVSAAGGMLVVSPGFDPDVVAETLALGMVSLPGVMTPTEALGALKAGAQGVKLYPAASLGPGHLKALRDVMPKSAAIYPVGGVDETNAAAWRAAGATGLGFGGSLYKPGMTAQEVSSRADILVKAWGP
jgi:2-dehydro-3-deoxyphosphogalactonate aldolase